MKLTTSGRKAIGCRLWVYVVVLLFLIPFPSCPAQKKLDQLLVYGNGFLFGVAGASWLEWGYYKRREAWG